MNAFERKLINMMLNSKKLLGIYLKECESGYNKGTCTPSFIAALFTIAHLWKQPRCPTTYKID
jgi:hypothetical protein